MCARIVVHVLYAERFMEAYRVVHSVAAIRITYNMHAIQCVTIHLIDMLLFGIVAMLLSTGRH